MTVAAASAAGETQIQQRRSLAWLLLVRVIFVSLLLGGTILYQLRGSAGFRQVLPYFYLIVVLSYAQAMVSSLVLARARQLRFFTQAQIVWDLLVATALIYLTGGLDSPFPFLFLIVISSSSIFLPRRDVFFVAAAAVILYGSLLDLQYYRLWTTLGITRPPEQIATREVFYAVYIHFTAFLATAFLSGILAERLRRSELARTQSEIDYQEIESLNRAIQANITSGLLIINPQGKIRSFNREAERLTGFSLAEVYDRPVNDLFPLFLQADADALPAEGRRAEGCFVARDGKERLLGFRASPVYSPGGESLGKMVNFQDLTLVRAMEEQIKRADKLAAIGRLASGMAHEIRNPLASISGSIQLLLEQKYIHDEDRRLMGIVVKEADRLSRLLTDFLAYARPPHPRREDVNISALLNELIEMTEKDDRFGSLVIERNYPDALQLHVDAGQFRQVFWNLLCNATEACSGQGTVRISVGRNPGELEVEDSGPGIDDAVAGRIFEPFFTTKDHGTGLGLATVYAIVESHGGKIVIGRSSLGGARFSIQLPVTK